MQEIWIKTLKKKKLLSEGIERRQIMGDGGGREAEVGGGRGEGEAGMGGGLEGITTQS